MPRRLDYDLGSNYWRPTAAGASMADLAGGVGEALSSQADRLHRERLQRLEDEQQNKLVNRRAFLEDLAKRDIADGALGRLAAERFTLLPQEEQDYRQEVTQGIPTLPISASVARSMRDTAQQQAPGPRPVTDWDIEARLNLDRPADEVRREIEALPGERANEAIFSGPSAERQALDARFPSAVGRGGTGGMTVTEMEEAEFARAALLS